MADQTFNFRTTRLEPIRKLAALWQWMEPPLNALQALLGLLGLGGRLAPGGLRVPTAKRRS